MHPLTQWTKPSLLIGLLLLLVSPAWARPGRSLADGSTSSDNQIGDTAPGNEEDAALLNETLPLDAVLTYAHAHNSTIHAARNRVRAAQKVPPQASACDDPMVMWDNWDTPENLHLNEASNNIFRLSQRHCQLVGYLNCVAKLRHEHRSPSQPL